MTELPSTYRAEPHVLTLSLNEWNMHHQDTKTDQSLEPPPGCGKRLLPALVDEIALNDPERTFVSIARTSDIEDGFIDVNYHSFAKAVDRCAWWLI